MSQRFGAKVYLESKFLPNFWKKHRDSQIEIIGMIFEFEVKETSLS